jgi:hypothetical protein
MLPKRIGFLGFDGVAASNLVEALDVFATAVSMAAMAIGFHVIGSALSV